ncbi:GAF domain-containing protein [Deinococcus alpinitundrae]|uniref:GAF domain-containing protein n=1 Tax=Deinococcus alpinitundrae TaxID=468913 RepID=UPI001379FE62|nr:GAF domain-containing protein [Deinococcus alpinitundrae]
MSDPSSHQERRKLQAIIDASADCIKVLDLDAHLLSMNAGGMATMEVDDFGRCQHVVWPSFWEGESRLQVEAAVEAARLGQTSTFEGPALTFAGTPKWWEVRVSPIWGEDGTVTQLLAISRDVTARKTAEQQLQVSEQRLRERADHLDLQVSHNERALAAFVRFTTEVASSTDLEVLARAALQGVQDVISGATSGFYLIRGDTAYPLMFSDNTPPAVRTLRQQGFSLQAPLVTEALQERQVAFAEHDQGRQQSVGYASALSITPYFREGQPYALFASGIDRPNWTAQEKAIIESVGRGLGLALERSDQTQQLQERTRQLEAEGRAREAFAAFAEAVGTQTDVKAIARQAIEVLQGRFPEASVGYYEPEGELWKARLWTNDVNAEVLALMRAGLPPQTPMIAEPLRTRQPVFTDAWDPQREHLAHTDEYGTVGNYPLIVKGQVEGLLSVGLRGVRQWGEADKALVRSVGHGLTQALERTAASRRLEEQNAELHAQTLALEGVAALTRDLTLPGGPPHLIGQVMDLVLSLLPSGYASFWEINNGLWRLTAHRGEVGSPEWQAARERGFPVGQIPTLDQPWQSRQPYFQSHYDPVHDAVSDLVKPLVSVASLPVVVQGDVIGVFSVGLFGHREWNVADRALLTTAVQSLGLALERAEQARQLTAQRDMLQAANEELEAFTYSISHDLRTPVRHILSFTGLLRRTLPEPLGEKAERYFRVIGEAAQHLSQLIDGMLELSRTSRQPFQAQQVDLGRLIEVAREELTLGHAGRRITWQVAPLPTVLGDVGLLRRVLMALLDNAMKYTRTRQEALIEVWAEDQEQTWAVFVRDNGVGFDQRYLDKLFTMFQRLHQQTDFEGAAMSLANARRIITRHGGLMMAEGQVDVGATFSFTLPKNHH